MIFLGADHGGYMAKQLLCEYFEKKGIAYTDMGAKTLDPDDDYPMIARVVVQKILESKENRGILLCRTGSGMVIAANRWKGIRAVEGWSSEVVRLSRAHNDANILSLSGDFLTVEQMQEFVNLFLSTPFSNEKRHVRRIEQIDSLV